MKSISFRDLLSLLLTLLFAFTVTPIALGQQSSDGKWKATYMTDGTDAREAEIELNGNTGTWMIWPRPNKDKKDACVNRPFPVTVSKNNQGVMTIQMMASTNVSGCKDRIATLEPAPDGSWSGKLDNGNKIMLHRSK
jgi:hypothetical protein